MREYAKVFPRFWQAGTGKALRGDPETQVLALYLMTSPHANMIGVFHCPIQYMAHETGLTLEGASKALARLIEGKFCTFDGEDEVVWVHEMAAHQIGTDLSPKDKQVLGIAKQYAQIAQSQIRLGFYARYRKDFHLPDEVENASPLQAPCKPLRSQEQEQEQEQEKKDGFAISSPGKPDDPPKSPGSGIPHCPQQAILDLYAEVLPELPQPRAWEGARETNLRARWRWALTATKPKTGERYATDEESGLAFFRRFFAYVHESDFLMGRGKSGWGGCDLGWLVKAENFSKVIAGNYETKEAA